MKPFINYMYPINFTGSIRRLENTTFHLQRTNVPALTGNAVVVNTRLNPLRVGYDSLGYHELNWSFMVDENLNNYMELFDWMHGIAFPQDHSQYFGDRTPEVPSSLTSDISVMIQNSSKNNIATVTFKDAFPTSLGDLNFDATVSESMPLICEVSFNYNYYEIERY